MANALSNSLSQISETLSKLKSGLSTISGDEKKKFESSSAPAQLASGLNQLSGTISSSSARRAVDNAKANNNIKTTSASDNYAEQLQTLMGKVTTAEAAQKKAEAAQTNAEADLSIKEQQQGGIETALAVAKKGDGEDTTTETTQDTTGQTPVSKLSPEDVATFGLTPEQATDPFTVSQVERFKGNSEIIGSTITAMGEMLATESEETKALMANIDAMTKNQQAQITAEYRKRQAGAALAGIIAGHALYSPEEHQGLIAEVVLEGKAKLDEIALEGTKEKIKLQQNLRDFKYKTFIEQSDKLMALNDLKVDTVTAIQTELLRVNQEQRDNLLFDQSQEERDATILAEELIDASDEQIIAAAKANGITPGLLIGAVRSIKPDPVVYSGGSGGSGGGSGYINTTEGGGALDKLNPEDKLFVESLLDKAMNDPDNFNMSEVPDEFERVFQVALAEKKKQKQLDEIDMPDLTQSFIDDLNWLNDNDNLKWYNVFSKDDKNKFQDAAAQAGFANALTGETSDIKRMLNTKEGQKALRAMRENEIKVGTDFSKQERADKIMEMLINGFDYKGEHTEGAFAATIREREAEKNRKKKELANESIYVTTPETKIKKAEPAPEKDKKVIWGINT